VISRSGSKAQEINPNKQKKGKKVGKVTVCVWLYVLRLVLFWCCDGYGSVGKVTVVLEPFVDDDGCCCWNCLWLLMMMLWCFEILWCSRKLGFLILMLQRLMFEIIFFLFALIFDSIYRPKIMVSITQWIEVW
jgi:hypothetical protein